MAHKLPPPSKPTTANALRAGAAALRKDAAMFTFEAHLFSRHGVSKYATYYRRRERLLAQADVLEDLAKKP